MSLFKDSIIEYARETLKTPFVHQGRVLGVGMDCVAVAIHVAKRLGFIYTDVEGYSRGPTGALLESAFNSQECIYRDLDIKNLQHGDILLMRFAIEPQHVAIYNKKGNTIIHGYEAVGMVCEHSLTEIWKKRIVCVYRFEDKTQ